MNLKKILVLSLITLSIINIDAGYFEKLKNFIGNNRKISEASLATTANIGFTAISTYFLPSLQDVSFSAATLLGSVAARNFKNYKYRYPVNGGISLAFLIIGNTAPGDLNNYQIITNIAVQFLVTNFLFLANDLAKVSGRERGESLFEHLLRTEEDEPQENTDIEMQVINYAAVADSSQSGSLNSSLTNSEPSEDDSDNGSSVVPISEISPER